MEIYVIDLHRDRMDPPTGLKRMWEKARQYNVTNIGVEAVFHQKSLLKWLDVAGIKGLPVTPLTYKEGGAEKSRSKVFRILGLAPYFERGQIHLPSGSTDVATFINEEYLPFPDAAHPDRLDALEMAMRLIPQYTQQWRFY